jgi:lipopolysaccharide export system protein LptA
MARKDDRQKPMDLHATSTDGFNMPNSITTLIGNVVAIQGTLKMTGAKAVLNIDADTQISHIHVTSAPGKQAHIEQIDDAGNLMTGDADTLDYDNINGIAVLTGHAVVHQQGRGGQVHMVILPKPQPAAGAKPAAPAPAGSTPSSKLP